MLALFLYSRLLMFTIVKFLPSQPISGFKGSLQLCRRSSNCLLATTLPLTIGILFPGNILTVLRWTCLLLKTKKKYKILTSNQLAFITCTKSKLLSKCSIKLKSKSSIVFNQIFFYMNYGRVALEPIWIFLIFGEDKNWLKFCKFQILAVVVSDQYVLTKTSLIDIYVTRSPDNKTSHTLIVQEWIIINMIIFAAFGLLFNFVFQSQQNNAAFLVLLVQYEQAFQQLVSAIRRHRVCSNRCHLRNRPWSWTLPHPAVMVWNTFPW